MVHHVLLARICSLIFKPKIIIGNQRISKMTNLLLLRMLFCVMGFLNEMG